MNLTGKILPEAYSSAVLFHYENFNSLDIETYVLELASIIMITLHLIHVNTIQSNRAASKSRYCNVTSIK